MSLLSVQDELIRRQIPFKKSLDGSLLANIRGPGKSFPVRINKEGEWIATCVEFSKTQKFVLNHEGLCTFVATFSQAQVHLGFSAKKGRFFAYDYLGPDFWQEEMNLFINHCELLTPLLERVGEIGRWDPLLVELAFADPSKMLRA